MKEIKWANAKYGSSKSANLGHNFVLIANYPLANEGFEGFVLGKLIGSFDSQEKCVEACEKVALEIIKDIYKNYITETQSYPNQSEESQ